MIRRAGRWNCGIQLELASYGRLPFSWMDFVCGQRTPWVTLTTAGPERQDDACNRFNLRVAPILLSLTTNEPGASGVRGKHGPLGPCPYGRIRTAAAAG